VLVVLDGRHARFASRDAGLGAFIYKGFAELIDIIPSIGEKPVGFWQIVHQGRSASIITDLPSGYEQADRTADGVCYSMQFGVHAAFSQPDQASTPPFFDRRLEAVRCALRCVASIEMVVLSGACSANPIMIRANTPISLQRFQRLYNVFGGPYSAGASHHLKPLRLTKIMPLRTRLSSTRARPRLFGK
jgi:hypothetical protein